MKPKPEDTVKKLLGEDEGAGTATPTPGNRFMGVEIHLDGVVVEGLDIEIAADSSTEDRFRLGQALKSAALEVCARPEFAKMTVDVTGFR